MSNPEEYDYNKFLSDSSDDCPKYDEPRLTEKQQDELMDEVRIVFKQADDDMNYQEAYSQNEVGFALSKVLEESSAEDKYIKVVKDYFFHSGQAVFNNSQIAQDNRG